MLRTFLFVLIFLFVSCASKSQRATRAVLPRFLELQREQSIATVHFPRGDYSLADEDRDGYYYRSPRSVIKHAFAGSQPYDGGIFLSKKGNRLRGYIVWAGGWTKVGNISPSAIQFRN